MPSLLCGIYGCHILVTTVSKLEELCPFRYIVVFRLLDLFLMVFGLQHPVFDFLARLGLFGCGTVLPPLETAFCKRPLITILFYIVFILVWKNFITVLEALTVSIIATLMLKPSQSALFDKYPSCRSVVSMSTIETSADDVDLNQIDLSK